MWRSVKQETSAFTACPECNFEYVLRVPESGMLGGDTRARRWLRGAKFRALVARDTVGLPVVILQMRIFSIGRPAFTTIPGVSFPAHCFANP